MKFDQLKASLKETIMPVYLLEGEEVFFRDRGEDLIKNAAMEEPQLNYARFEGSSFKQSGLDVLINALAACPFMSERRVITVTEWYPTAQDLKDKGLKAYFEKPFDTSVLVIVNSKKCEALKKQKSVTLVDCAKGSPELITKYVRAKATKAGLIINTNTCRLLIDYCLSDMTRIDGEVDKLIAYSHGEDEITEAAVDAMVTKSFDYQIYQMVNFIAGKRYSEAYKVLRELNSIGDRQILFVSIYYHFRKMFFVSISPKTDSELAEELSMNEYAVKKTREQASHFSPKRLKNVMSKFAHLDGAFKSGKLTFDNAFIDGVFSVLTE